MRSLNRIRMFRHPSILKYIEGDESENGVFYVCLYAGMQFICIGDRIGYSTFRMARLCKGKESEE